jgi:hypothetical protein
MVRACGLGRNQFAGSLNLSRTNKQTKLIRAVLRCSFDVCLMRFAARLISNSFVPTATPWGPKFIARSLAYPHSKFATNFLVPLRKFVLKILAFTKIVGEQCDVRHRYHSENEYGEV